MNRTFNGFNRQFFKFFKDLADNNNRQWFQDNKARYEDQVAEPLLAFIENMGPRLRKVSKQYNAIPKKTGGSMFRIYRDVRFSKNKDPYKTHGACHFRHVLGKDAHAPGFYVHLEPGKIFFGGGIWVPPAPALNQIRATINDSPAAWKRILNNKKIQQRFGGIRGDGLKTKPKGYPADHPNIEDLKRKSFFLMQEAKPSLANSAAFLDEVEANFKTAKPLMQFICHALEIPF